jgi:hypothetical protein
VLSDFYFQPPVAIEPLIGVIECTVTRNDRARSVRLFRLDYSDEIMNNLTVSSKHPIYFGDGTTIHDTSYVACYYPSGYLCSVHVVEDGELVELVVEDEEVGRPPKYPSVRFILDDEVAAAAVTSLWRQICEGDSTDFTHIQLARLLMEHSVAAPRSIEVAITPPDASDYPSYAELE